MRRARLIIRLPGGFGLEAEIAIMVSSLVSRFTLWSFEATFRRDDIASPTIGDERLTMAGRDYRNGGASAERRNAIGATCW